MEKKKEKERTGEGKYGEEITKYSEKQMEREMKYKTLSRGEGGGRMMTIYCSNTFSLGGEGEGWPTTTKEAKNNTNKLEIGNQLFFSSLPSRLVNFF